MRNLKFDFSKLKSFPKLDKKKLIIILTPILLLSLFLIINLYQTFSMYTESEGMSIIDGINTYKFILNANNSTNSMILAAGSSKTVDITVSNGSESNLKYGLYYKTTNVDEINIGYLLDESDVFNEVIDKNSNNVVTIKVENYSSSSVTINLGVKYGFIGGGDLSLDTNEYLMDEYSGMNQAFYSSTDNSLNFVNSGMLNVGNVYKGKTIDAVYTGFETTIYYSSVEIPWYKDGNYDDVTTVVFDTTIVPSMTTKYWFRNFTNLTNIIGLKKLDTSNVTSMSEMFNGCTSLTSLDLSGFDTSRVTDMSLMFQKCKTLTSLNLSTFDTSNVTNIGGMFKECSSLTSLDLSSFNTSNVTDMSSVFLLCSSLTSLDLSNFNTSNVTTFGSSDWYGMFTECASLTSLDLSSFNTSKATSMGCMFYGCSSLTSLDLSNFDTSNVRIMGNMFNNCKSLTSLDLSNFNTNNVESMGGMFNGCTNLVELDISSFNTAKVTNVSMMFQFCYKLTNLDMSGFDFSNATSLQFMFYDCGVKTLGNVNFVISTEANISWLFRVARNINVTITIKNPNITSYDNIFYNAAINDGAQITVNYTTETSQLVDDMIGNASGNVVKGVLVT